MYIYPYFRLCNYHRTQVDKALGFSPFDLLYLDERGAIIHLSPFVQSSCQPARTTKILSEYKVKKVHTYESITIK